MKTKFSNLKKMVLTALFIFTAQFTFGVTYYAYKNKTVTLTGAGAFTAYKWILVTVAGTETSSEITGQTSATLNYSFTASGTYKIRLIVKEANGCWSDVDTSKDIDVFVLPELTVTVDVDGSIPATYCTNALAAERTTLKATGTATGLPSEVTISVAEWYKTPSTGDLTGLSSISSGVTYLLTEASQGTHYYVATGKYVIPANRLISAADAPTSSAPKIITINAAPTTPTITPTVVG